MAYLKTAYLTIDDSPSIHFIDKIDLLSKHQIPAILFCIGQLMEERPDQTIEAIKRGFPIANHSFTHPHFSDISVEDCILEIQKTDELIEDLYRQAGVQRKFRWFRFPYGDKGDKKNGQIFNKKAIGDIQRKSAIQQALKELNYTLPTFSNIDYRYMENAGLWQDIDWPWTFDIMEWATFESRPTLRIKNLHKIFQRMEEPFPADCRGPLGKEKRWLKSPSAEIILLHDHTQTSTIFTSIIEKLKTLPLRFEAISPNAI